MQAIKVSFLAIILSFGIGYVLAWTAPTAIPPAGNVSAPINTSTTAQTKAGALTVGNITLATGGKITFADNTTLSSAPPQITSFTATSNIVQSGATTTLVWTTKNLPVAPATPCTKSGSWSGGPVQGSGSDFTSVITGPANTVYTLTCTSASGEVVSQSVSVTVLKAESFTVTNGATAQVSIPYGVTKLTFIGKGGNGGNGWNQYSTYGGFGADTNISGIKVAYSGEGYRDSVYPERGDFGLNVSGTNGTCYGGAGSASGGDGGTGTCGGAVGGKGINTATNKGVGGYTTTYLYGSGGGGGGAAYVLAGATPLLVLGGGGGGRYWLCSPGGGGGGYSGGGGGAISPYASSNGCPPGASGGGGGGTYRGSTTYDATGGSVSLLLSSVGLTAPLSITIGSALGGTTQAATYTGTAGQPGTMTVSW